MAIEIRSFESESDLSAAAKELKNRTMMIVDAVGIGKTFDSKCLIDRDWAPFSDDPHSHALPGTVVGLLDQNGFCLALGIVDTLIRDRIVVYTPWRDPASVARIHLGKVRINRSDFSETG